MLQLFKVEITCASSYYSTIAICICIDSIIGNIYTAQNEFETVVHEQAHFERAYTC